MSSATAHAFISSSSSSFQSPRLSGRPVANENAAYDVARVSQSQPPPATPALNAARPARHSYLRRVIAVEVFRGGGSRRRRGHTTWIFRGDVVVRDGRFRRRPRVLVR